MKNFEDVLSTIVAWPELVYEEEAFPDVVAFCKFFAEGGDEYATSVLLKIKEITKESEEAIRSQDVQKIKGLEKEYRKLMRNIKKNGGAL